MEAVGSGGLQVFQVAVFAGLALQAHLVIAHARKPLLKKVQRDTHAPVRELSLVGDAVMILLYLGYIAGSFTLEGGEVVTGQAVEGVLDRLAPFCGFVAALESSALAVLVRLCHGMDPWPSRHAPTPTATA